MLLVRSPGDKLQDDASGDARARRRSGEKTGERRRGRNDQQEDRRRRVQEGAHVMTSFMLSHAHTELYFSSV